MGCVHKTMTKLVVESSRENVCVCKYVCVGVYFKNTFGTENHCTVLSTLCRITRIDRDGTLAIFSAIWRAYSLANFVEENYKKVVHAPFTLSVHLEF